MCFHGTLTEVEVIGGKKVLIDACIADEIIRLNIGGVVTLACCCGHGGSGQITEWENGFGRWKGYTDPPHVLIRDDSKILAEKLGYRPFPYVYADGEQCGVWKMYLQTGGLTADDCVEWNKKEEYEAPLV